MAPLFRGVGMHGTDMALVLAFVAVRSIGTNVHAVVVVIENYLDQETIVRSTKAATIIGLGHGKGIIVEIEAFDAGIGWDGINAFFPARREHLDRRHLVHFRVVVFGNGRGAREVAPEGAILRSSAGSRQASLAITASQAKDGS